MGFPRTQRSRREGPSRLISRQTSNVMMPHHAVRVFCNSREQMASPVHAEPRGRDQAPSLGLPPDPRVRRQMPGQRDTAPNSRRHSSHGRQIRPDSPPGPSWHGVPCRSTRGPLAPRTTSRHPQEQPEAAKAALACKPEGNDTAPPLPGQETPRL